MFTYQKDTKSLFVAECGKKDFWREIRKSSTAFNIDTRREILRAVDAKDEEAMQKWAEHTDFQKFMLKTLRDLKTKPEDQGRQGEMAAEAFREETAGMG